MVKNWGNIYVCSRLCCCCIHLGRIELFYERHLLAVLKYELLHIPNRHIINMLSSYDGHAVYLSVSHEIFMMIGNSSIMIHAEVFFNHVQVRDVGKLGLPMTVMCENRVL